MTRVRTSALLGLGLLGLAAAGCEGAPATPGGAAGSSSGGSASSGAPAVTPEGFLSSSALRSAPLRRLTRAEYRNTVRELFGVEPPAAQVLPDDSLSSGFTSTSNQLVTIASVNRYLDAATEVAAKVEPSIRTLMPCAATDSAGESACIEQYLTSLGPRLFRRPLAADEKARYVGAFGKARASQSYEQSASLMIEALLVAPELLFVELPSGGVSGAKHPLDSWQVASRLSLLLWDSLPDSALFAAAEQGQLTSPAALREHVDRLLADPRTRAPVRSLFDDWLGFTKIEGLVRDAAQYPTVTPPLLRELAEESRAFVDDVFWQSNDFRRLFVSPARFRSPALSAFYGEPLGQAPGVARYEGEVTERSFGLLSQAGFLMTLAQAEKSAPIHRGVFLRRKLLCGVLPPPPPGLATPLPELTAGVSKRQRITDHTSGGGCIGCHRTFNGLGFALDHFDIAGQWREQDEGLPVDSHVTFDEPGIAGEIDGARALSEALAQSPNARACAVQQLFTFALERAPTSADQALFDDLVRKFVDTGFSMKALLAELILSDDFRARSEPEGSTP